MPPGEGRRPADRKRSAPLNVMQIVKRTRMSPRAWTKLVFFLLLVFLFGTVALVAFVDPFQIYHAAAHFVPPCENGVQNYANAGVARSWDYDSVVIGSSMTENFVPSQLDALFGGRFVKLPINAGSPYNHRQMMELAFRTHEIKTVLCCVDADALTYFYTQPKTEMPDYLYSESLADDVSYWFNVSVLFKYIPRCLASWGRTDPDLRDKMYAWGDLYPYGAEAALKGARIDGTVYPQKECPAPFAMSQQTMLNVENNIVPFVEAHPETEFLFFFPPYALVSWYRFYRGGTLDYHLSQVEAVAARLLAYPNVRVYDFRARTDWILNLDNYIDDHHYGPWINAAMAEDMAAGRCRAAGAEETRENSRVLRELVSQITAAGRWPESFALPEASGPETAALPAEP